MERPIVHNYESLSDKVLEKIPLEWRNLPFAQVRGITEPLKVRIITAMAALSTYISKTMQKALWNYLARFPCFALITQPFSEDLLHQMLSNHRALYGEDSEWDFVSGDYSAATDNLKIQATKMVLDLIITKLSPSDASLAPHLREILLEQVLVYPRDAQQPPVLQANGQLMGSVLSFPILCILNLYTFFKTLDLQVQCDLISGRRSYKSLPVLINGDDILFRANQVRYDRWKVAGSAIGFELSLGKNFVHRRFFTVNSLPLEYISGRHTLAPLIKLGSVQASLLSWADIEDAPYGTFESRKVVSLDSVTVHGFLNVGLLVGLSKTSTGVRQDSVPLNGWFSGAILGSMYPTKMTNFFLNYHSREIKRQTTFGSRVLNIYAHPYLGGLGFPVPPGVEPRFSEHQRALASYLLKAAQQEFFGPPSEHPMKPFAFLTLSESASHSLGSKPGRVYTRLGSPNGPYTVGEVPFEDNSSIRATPLAMAYGDLDESVLTPSCRLSNSELHRLLKTANHQRSEMVSVSDMTTFPFNVIIYDPELDTIPAELDLATTISPPPPPAESPIPIVELWEIPNYPFLEAVKSFQLRPLQHRLDREVRLVHKAKMRMSKAERDHMNFQLRYVPPVKVANKKPELKW